MDDKKKEYIDFVEIEYIKMDKENTDIPTDTKAEKQIYVSISPRGYEPGFQYVDGKGGSMHKAEGFWTAPAKTESKDGTFDGPVSEWDAWKTSESHSFTEEGKRAIFVRPKADTIFIRPSLYKDFLTTFVYFCECGTSEELSVSEKRKFLVHVFKKTYPEFADVKHLVLKIDCLEDIFAYDAIFRPKFVMPKCKRMAERCAGKTYEEVTTYAKQYLKMLENGENTPNESLLVNLFGMFDDYNNFHKVYEKIISLGSEEKFQQYMRSLQKYPEYAERKPDLSNLLNSLGIIFNNMDASKPSNATGAMTHEYSYFSGLELTKKGCKASKFYYLNDDEIREFSYQRDVSKSKTVFNKTHVRNFFSMYDVPSLVIFDGDAIEFEREEVIQYTDRYKREGFWYDLWDEEEQNENLDVSNHRVSDKKDNGGEIDI